MWNHLKEENGRDPSLQEMAKELNLSARKVKAIMDTLSTAVGVESLTSFVGDEEEITLEEVLSDDGKGNPHDMILYSENINTLQESLLQLNERDREILSLRFGLSDNEPKTLGEVAERLGLSRERVRQIEERAVRQMRKAAQKAGLIERQEDNKRVGYKQESLFKITDQGPLVRALRRKALKKDKEKKASMPLPKKKSSVSKHIKKKVSAKRKRSRN